MHLRSPNAHATTSIIPPDLWGTLTTVDVRQKLDSRTNFHNALIQGQSWLDPEYRALEPWFEQMAKHFEEDIYAANELADCPPEFKEPDFIHEALQRLIFDFLMKHQGAQFMKLQKHTKNRTFKPLDTGPDLTPVTDSSVSEKRSRGTVERPEGDQGPRVSHIVLGQLLCTELTFGQRSNRVKQDAV